MGRLLCVAAFALAVALGCASFPGTVARQPEQLVTADGLLKVDDHLPGVLFVKPDHGMGGYDAFLIEPVEIRYRRGRPPLHPDDEARMRDYLHEAVSAGIASRDIAIAQEPGPCVVSISMEVVDLDLIDGRAVAGATTRIVRSLGEFTLLNEYRDSESGEVLIRFATRRSIEGGLYTGAGRGFDWRRMRHAFDHMMQCMHKAVIRRTPELANSPLRPGCEGVLAQRAAEMLAASGR